MSDLGPPTSYVSVPLDGAAHDHDDVVVDETAGGTLLLAANPSRKSAHVANMGEGNIRVTTDGSAPTPTHGKPVPAGATFTMSSPFCPVKEVKAIREGDTDATVNASEVT